MLYYLLTLRDSWVYAEVSNDYELYMRDTKMMIYSLLIWSLLIEVGSNGLLEPKYVLQSHKYDMIYVT